MISLKHLAKVYRTDEVETTALRPRAGFEDGVAVGRLGGGAGGQRKAMGGLMKQVR